MNDDKADFYFYNMNLNLVPVYDRSKTPRVEYKPWMTKSMPSEIYEHYKRNKMYENFAMINGLIHRGGKKGYYIHTIDCDSQDAINAVCTINGVCYTLEQLSQRGVLVQQHCKERANIFVLSEKPFPKLTAGNQLKLEVKGEGQLTILAGSKHKDGNYYEFVGKDPRTVDDHGLTIHTDFMYHINNILKPYGVDYLNGKAKKNTKVSINLGEKWHEGERNDKLFNYTLDVLKQLGKNTPNDVIKRMVFDMNETQCEPPLPVAEVEQIWKSAPNYVLPTEGNGNGNGNGNNGDEDKKRKRLKVAFETVKQQVRNLFVDEYNTPYVAIPIQDHLEIFPIESNSFRNWYRMFIFDRDGIVLDNATINELCSLACAYASSPKYGTQINLYLRTASNSNFTAQTEWYYDLTNKKWEFVKITSNGWEISKNEIIFRRYNNQKVQVYPDKYYEPGILDKFMTLVNIKSDDKDSILLLKIYIISLFIPEIQKVVLSLHGSQGAAKSFLEELIKMLVDPSIVKTLTFPRDLNELIQQLSHNYVTYYDNVSIIRPWISDQLCRAVSGSGSSKRQLYTDDDDIIRSFKRCIGINGINLAADRADLLDRSITIKLERIEDGKQRTPEEIWKEFDEIRPQLLGYIFDTLVRVLKYEQDNPEKKFKLFRMTEFSKYGEIISRCIGNEDNEFLGAYERNRQLQVDEIVESSQVATVLMNMMFEKYNELKEWEGTPTALYGEIKSIVDMDEKRETRLLNINTNDKYWPKTVRSFGRRLNELIPTLKEKGLEITLERESDSKRTRKIKIRKMSSETSETSDGGKSR